MTTLGDVSFHNVLSVLSLDQYNRVAWKLLSLNILQNLKSTDKTDDLINTEVLLDIFIKFDHTFGKIAPYVLYTDDKHLSLFPMSKLLTKFLLQNLNNSF